jgi:hypothetical protein
MSNGGIVNEERPAEDWAGENGGVTEEEEVGDVEVTVKPSTEAEGDGDEVVVEGGDEGNARTDVKRPPGVAAAREDGAEEVGGDNGDRGTVGSESSGGRPGGGGVESGVARTDQPAVVDHLSDATPKTRVVLENGMRAAEEWHGDSDSSEGLEQQEPTGLDGPRANIAMEGDADDGANLERLEEKAMAKVIQGYVTKAVLADRTEKPGKNSEGNSSKSELQQSGDEPAVVIEELDDLSSTDDENTATSAPPARTTSSISSSPAQSSSAASSRSSGPSLPSRPAGLGSSSLLSQPPAHPVQQVHANGPATLDRGSQQATESAEDDGDEDDEIHQKLQMIRVKFLRLALRFGQTHQNMVVSHVLYRLGLAEQLRRSTAHGTFGYDAARQIAEHLEAVGNEPLDFSCTILVLGKTGVGKVLP